MFVQCRTTPPRSTQLNPILTEFKQFYAISGLIGWSYLCVQMIFNFLGLVTLKAFDLTMDSRVSYCATYLPRKRHCATYLPWKRHCATYLSWKRHCATYLPRKRHSTSSLEIGTAFLAVEGGTTLWDRFIVHQKARMFQKKLFYLLSLKLHGLMWVMLAEHLLPTREVKSSNLFNAKN